MNTKRREVRGRRGDGEERGRLGKKQARGEGMKQRRGRATYQKQSFPIFCNEGAVFPKAHDKLDLLEQGSLIEYACFPSFLVIILGGGMVYRDRHQV